MTFKNPETQKPIGRIEDKLYCDDGTVYFIKPTKIDLKGFDNSVNVNFDDWLNKNKELIKCHTKT